MAYIYVIKNDINNKVYIGKTNFQLKSVLKNILKIAPKQEKKKDRYIMP